jgi:chaperonin cofactor prefoldin
MINWSRITKWLFVFVIVAFIMLLFRKYIPYGTEAAIALGIEDQLPTTDTVIHTIQTSPLQSLGYTGLLGTLAVPAVKAVTQFRTMLAERQGDINRLTGVRENLNNTLQTVRDEKSKLEETFNTTKNQLDSTKAEFEGYKTSVQTTVENSTRAVADSQLQINTLSQQNTELQNEIKKLQQQVYASQVSLLDQRPTTSH